MKISIVGTGYVGLVTGVSLAEIGHHVTCIDKDESIVERLNKEYCPIYEPGLEEMLKKNIRLGRLSFDSNPRKAFRDSEAIFLTVGTPAQEDGAVDLRYIRQAAMDVAASISHYTIIVTKSTVPIGTNDLIKSIIEQHSPVSFDMVSNPEFLREGSALHDTFNGDRIVIGADNDEAAIMIANLYKPFGIPVYLTDIRSAEMIKYASNAFLATKISFINEIANLCEKLGANIESVSYGMGLDRRIGNNYLQAGIGYGGSCFPKDTRALVHLAGSVKQEFQLLKSVIEVNNRQKRMLIEMLKRRYPSLSNLRIAVLGLSFKANTDDLREAASLVVLKELLEEGASVAAYDPVAIEKARRLLPKEIVYAESPEDALSGADAALILTDWEEIRSFKLYRFRALMNRPVIFDGRNCYSLPEAEQAGVEYYSVGRPPVASVVRETAARHIPLATN